MDPDRPSLIIANWKMSPLTLEAALGLFQGVKKGLTRLCRGSGGQGAIKNVEVVICPPFLHLSHMRTHMRTNMRSYIRLGAQDVFWESKGAFTGEISPLMLKDAGCKYVIIGHSERRRYLGESDEIVKKKLEAALKYRLKPILCVGEEMRDTFDSQGREVREVSSVVVEQTEKALEGVNKTRVEDISIAYEPVWAIGTGNPATSDDAMKAGLLIRKIISQIYGRDVAGKIRILYGGSVTSKNARDYVQGAGMDGLLVGGGSLNASEFVRIVRSIAQI